MKEKKLGNETIFLKYLATDAHTYIHIYHNLVFKQYFSFCLFFYFYYFILSAIFGEITTYEIFTKIFLFFKMFIKLFELEIDFFFIINFNFMFFFMFDC